VSFIGTGGEDWVELDMDLFERNRMSQLHSLLASESRVIAAAIGSDFDVETVEGGIVFIVIEGRRRYRAEVNHNDRVVLTGILDPDGPL
jgi:hypothetical protein